MLWGAPAQIFQETEGKCRNGLKLNSSLLKIHKKVNLGPAEWTLYKDTDSL